MQAPSQTLWVTLGLSLAGCGGASAGNGAAAPGLEETAREVSAAQFESARMSDGSDAASTDVTGGAWRIIEVPAASNQPALVSTPAGWFALSRRQLGEAKAPSGAESVLYRSTDGVHWRSVPLEPGHDDLMLSGLAYGEGRYVMVGTRGFDQGVIWTSADAQHWTEQAQPVDSADVWRDVTFAGGRFFGLGFRYLGVSESGESWRSVPITNVQHRAVAYGNGRYLLVGSGPKQVSEDGWSWQERLLDCALPGACISDPSGGVHQHVHNFALFAEGRFFIDQLSTAEGTQWQPLPDRYPSAYVSGRFLGSPGPHALQAWTSDGPIETLHVVRPARAAVTRAGRAMTGIGVLDHTLPLPEQVNVEFEDGLNCASATCIIIDHRLLLVPPSGTPPLADRIPRRSDGAPLLSDECPVSSMIFCDDYSARTGCSCSPEAPMSPASCLDVSQYACAGAFTARDGEWQVEEVAQAGCSCSAVDPNQPAGFGAECLEGSNSCSAPFQCLPMQNTSPFPDARFMCSTECSSDADCPSWQATGFCAGPVQLRCAGGACQPRTCD